VIELSDKRVLHVLANSAPDVNGYAIRTHDLLLSLKEANICHPIALTSPYYPDREAMHIDAEIDGIRYLRTNFMSKKNIRKNSLSGFNVPDNTILLVRMYKFTIYKLGLIIRQIFRPLYRKITLFRRFLGERRMMKRYEKHIIEQAIGQNVEMIHAHTPFRVGLPALRAARKLNLPFIYEVRGMWEDSAVAQGRWKTRSIPYRYYRRQENKVIAKADEIIAIGTCLGDEIIRRKLRDTLPVIVPNAVGLGFANKKPEIESQRSEDSKELEQRLNKNEETIVVGYIGSLRKLEGVDYTAMAVAKLVKKGLDVRFLVCSSKPNQDNLIQLCSSLDISEISFIEGPFPHEDIVHFYDLIDIFVVSRPDSNVTRIVPPIKPLEAMIRGIPTIVSELPALCEIITDGVTGMIFPAENVESLAEVIARLSKDINLRETIGRAGREYTLNNRTWADVVGLYDEVYRRY
jgi:glycosyltransferase involved in cell wall biosynthesis